VSAYLDAVLVRRFGLVSYQPIFEKMLEFSTARNDETPDEFWLLQHRPVYTLGRNSKAHHILNTGDIPVVQVDRGGQVTYHGPGQIIIYPLVDIRRKQLGVRQVVTAMESAIVNTLEQLGIQAYPKPKAPGVYVADKKIASLGLRIKNGKSYHGLALNVDMDLTPFQGINPCGYEGLEVTQVSNEVSKFSLCDIETALIQALASELNYKEVKELIND